MFEILYPELANTPPWGGLGIGNLRNVLNQLDSEAQIKEMDKDGHLISFACVL